MSKRFTVTLRYYTISHYVFYVLRDVMCFSSHCRRHQEHLCSFWISLCGLAAQTTHQVLCAP